MVTFLDAYHLLTCVLYMQPAGSLVAKAKSLDRVRAVVTSLKLATTSMTSAMSCVPSTDMYPPCAASRIFGGKGEEPGSS